MQQQGATNFTIFARTHYNQTTQCYTNVLVVDKMPRGALQKFIRQINFPMLTEHYQASQCCNGLKKCALAIQLNSGNCCSITTANELPKLVSFLIENGYQVETQLTSLMTQKHAARTGSKLMMNVSYYGDNPPQITYMR